MRCPHCQTVAVRNNEYLPQRGLDPNQKEYACQNSFCKCIFFVTRDKTKPIEQHDFWSMDKGVKIE